jgi:hypothetical protein
MCVVLRVLGIEGKRKDLEDDSGMVSFGRGRFELLAKEVKVVFAGIYAWIYGYFWMALFILFLAYIIHALFDLKYAQLILLLFAFL